MTRQSYEDLKKQIEQINVLVREKNTRLDRGVADEYFDSFRKLFSLSAHKIKMLESEDQRRAVIWDIVELNGLYGLQLTLNVELPKDLEEIAYDYDHDDYPGYEYRLSNILQNKYLVLGGKGHSS